MRNLFKRKSQPKTLAQQASAKMELAEVLTKFDIVQLVENGGDPFLIVADRGSETTGTEVIAHTEYGAITARDPERGMQMASGTISEDAQLVAMLGELGSASPSPFTSSFRREYNRELQGLQGLKKYDMMRRSDGVVRGSLKLYKTPVLAGRWFVEPASQSKRDVNAADFVWKCLTELMSISWPQILQEALLMADFGYYMFEKVWEERVVDGKNRLVLKKLAPRHPMDVLQWKYDGNGGPLGVLMYPPSMMSQDYVAIPISKLLVFTHDKEAGNIEGMSVLRSAYKHWYFKEQLYKIDAIQKERHGIGIPVIKLPLQYSAADLLAADQMGRNLRTNEKAHVVLPPGWDLLFAELKGQPVDALKSVAMHDNAIRENVLGGFLNPDKTTKEEDQTLFLKATRFVADVVTAVFNTYLIPELMNYNFNKVGTPKLRVRRIGEIEDQRTLSFAVRNLIGAEALTPDDKLEDYLRDQLDLPARDPETARFPNARETVSVQGVLGPDGQPLPAPVVAPGSPSPAPKQNGAKAGMPRQTPVRAKLPAKQGGTDRSGG